MFNRKFLSLIFTVSFLAASNIQEKSVKKNNNDAIKKVVAFGLGLAGTLASEKTAYLEVGNSSQISYFGSIFESQIVTVLCANAKLCPFVLVNKEIISFKNGQRVCQAISALHGACVCFASYKVLNRFFPS